MGKDEKTGTKIKSLAGKVLAGDLKPTHAQILSMAASLLNQAPDKPAPKKTK